ncbi:hypothetical protein VPNG_09164 [Cytospora leucostoma]|uniref:Ketoreductase (KR) domain-containing protein n=1 Tax=Cytospora leucostoma TaxID=1230097 RepID=A0A423VYF2_9PEZI|nr:hypothetical protein VPNG_09164 [Cytospora leucostoma]
MSGKTYLSTGAHRGIGRGMSDHYVNHPTLTVVATVRNGEGAQGLLSLPYKGENTESIVTKFGSASKTDAYDAINDIEAQGVHHIDVAISSAGIAQLNTIEDGPSEEVMQINAISVMVLYKATLPLLRKAPQPARFAFISAADGSLNGMPKYPYPNVSYAGFKALANVIVIDNVTKVTKGNTEKFFNEIIDRKHPW